MVKLIVDSTCDLPMEETKKLGVEVIPIKVRFGEEEFLAGVNLTNDEFYKKLKMEKALPHTTQINQNEYCDIIKPFLDKGDDVFVMSMSSGLSGTFNSLRLAKEELNSDKLEIYDTQTVTISYAALVLEAVKLIKGGATLKELKEEMEKLKNKVRVLAIIDNVKYLVKGGRLSMAAGLLAGVLKIKPIIDIAGKVEMKAKAIGFPMAKKAFCKLIKNVDESMPIYYGHSNSPEKAEEIKQTVEQEFGFKFTACYEIGPVVGTYGGPGCCGIAYFEK